MKFAIGLILFLLIQTEVFSQSVASSNSSNTETISRKTIDSINDAAFNIYLEFPDSARVLAEKALILSEKAKYPFGIGRSFLNIGHVYWSQSYYPIALFYLNKAMVNIPKSEPLYISAGYNIIGRTYSDLKNYKEALSNLDRSALYAQGDADRMGEVYSERSLVYKRQGKYTEALKNAYRALELNRIARDERNIAVLYGRLSTIYTLTAQYKQSIACSDTALAMSFTTHNKRLGNYI